MIGLWLAAQVVDAQNPCVTQRNQMEMNDCSRRNYDAANTDLNRTWRILLVEVRKFDREQEHATYPGVVSAQRDWLKFRDSECKAEADQYFGASLRPVVLFDCLRRVTSARTKELNDLAEEYRR